MENRYPLKEFLEKPGNTQVSLAQSVGITQGAVFQMLRAKRNIFVIVSADGSISLEEVKVIRGSEPLVGSA